MTSLHCILRLLLLFVSISIKFSIERVTVTENLLDKITGKEILFSY